VPKTEDGRLEQNMVDFFTNMVDQPSSDFVTHRIRRFQNVTSNLI